MDRSTMVLALLVELDQTNKAMQEHIDDQDKVRSLVSYKQGLDFALRLFVGEEE